MTAPRLMSIVALALTAAPAVATTNEFAPQLQVVAEAEVAPIAASPDIVAAVRAQNAETAGLDQPAIDALDAD